jgi:hypothetical protein
MRKISTVVLDGIEKFKGHKLTIGLDLGDRFSQYCILNESGDVIAEQNLPTTPKGIDDVFRRIPRSRVALETGTHSPWVSRQLARWGHEVIPPVAAKCCATRPLRRPEPEGAELRQSPLLDRPKTPARWRRNRPRYPPSSAALAENLPAR